MRKIFFSLKSFVLTLALVVGGSAWAQITSLPFVADFSSDAIAPFTGDAAFVATTTEGGKAISVNNGEAYAAFSFADAPYVISNADEVTVSFQMLNGWLGSGGGNKFALLNSDGVALASISYDNKSCNINEVVIGGTAVEGFEAFNGQSSAGAKGANGYDNGKSQGFKLNTAETKYNAEVTIKINAFGGISISFVGGKNNNDKFWSGTAGEAKLNLDKMFITNASNNGDRATGYYGLTITNKSMIRVSKDYSDGVADWTTGNADRYLVNINEGGYLTIDAVGNGNNGTAMTGTTVNGSVAAGENFATSEDFTMSFDLQLTGGNNQASSFYIYDAANATATAILGLEATAANATTWKVNGSDKQILDLAKATWYSFKVTKAGEKLYLTVTPTDGGEALMNQQQITVNSALGGLGNMIFNTKRYSAFLAIDNVVVRDVIDSEDIPQTPIYTYTVMFVDQNGEEFQDPSVREEYADVELAITDEDKATITIGKSQYIYVSDDAEGQTAVDDGSTVITVVYEKTTVADYTVDFVDGEGVAIKDAVVHKNALVGSTVAATAGEISKILIDGVFYEYVSGNTPLVVSENEEENVIHLVFVPVAGVTGYYYQNYEAGTVDWTTSVSGRFNPIIIDGSTVADREVAEGEPVPFGNKTNFLAADQNTRNQNGAQMNSSALNIDQADFTFEAKLILGVPERDKCSFNVRNFANNADIFTITPAAANATNTSWVINGDAENFTIDLPNTGNVAAQNGNNTLNNYSWYNFKVTVYNGITFVTITDEAGEFILDKAQVPTSATTYGISNMTFPTGRYHGNFAIDDVVVRSVDTNEDIPAGSEFAAVTINYVDENGSPLKEPETANFQVGAPIELNSAFIADFKVTESGEVWTAESTEAPVTKYIYVSDNSADVTVGEGAAVNVVFRGVASRRIAFRYQIQKADGTITTKDAAGKNLPFFYRSDLVGDILFEGDELTFYYPYYLLVDGLLYQTSANGSGSDKGTYVVEAGTGTATKTPVTWTPAYETVVVVDPETTEESEEQVQISNAVFASETEMIDGITVVKDGYTQIRMANGATGSAIGGDVLVTTLEPGKYTLTTATRSGTTNFTANGEIIATISSSGTVTTVTSEEFTLLQTTPIYIQAQTSTSQYSDYVLIRKTANIESYAITVVEGIENGTVEAPAFAAADATVTLTATPAEGYELVGYTVTGVNTNLAVEVSAEGTFTMPADAVTVSATFAEIVPEIVLNAPVFNAEAGTQAEPNMLPAGSTLKINYSADNLAENGLTADEVQVKVTVLVSGDLPENQMSMGSETAHIVRGETFYIPLGETDFPVELKPGYVYQTIAVMSAELVIPATEEGSEDEVLAAAVAPARLPWVGLEAEAEPEQIEIAGVIYNVKSDNLFANGSFDNEVEGWKTIGYTTDAVIGDFTVTAEGGFDGGAYITTNGAGVGSSKTLRQSVAVEEGKQYYFTVYTSGKAPDANNFNYNALFQMTDATTENGVLKAFEWPQGAGQTSEEWSQTQFVFTAAEGNPYVGVRMGWNQNSSFDGFALYEVEEVGIDFDYFKEAALAEIATLPVGTSIFTYDEYDVEDALEAVRAAESIEEVELAVAALKENIQLPEEGVEYMFQLKDGGNYMSISEGKIVLAEKPQPLLIVEVDGGYALSNGEEYVAFTGTGSDKWSMGATDAAYAWGINYISDGYYTISAANGKIGVDNTGAGSATYADKSGTDGKSQWSIGEYAYAGASDIAMTTDGIVTIEEGTRYTRIDVTFTPETLGLYEENSFVLSALATVDIYKGTGEEKELVKAGCSLNTGEFTDGLIYGNVEGLDYETEYTAVLKSFVVYDWSEWENYDAEYDIYGLVLYKLAEPQTITFKTITEEEATGIAGLKPATTVKADGKYLENGKIIIVKGGKTYSVMGVQRK